MSQDKAQGPINSHTYVTICLPQNHNKISGERELVRPFWWRQQYHCCRNVNYKL